MHKFKVEDLIQFLYNETNVKKTAQIISALETDWELKEKYDLLVFTQQRLQEVDLSPGPNAINKILSYAEKSVGEFSTSA